MRNTPSPSGLHCLSLVLMGTVTYKKGRGGFNQSLPKKFSWLGRTYLTNGGPQRRKSYKGGLVKLGTNALVGLCFPLLGPGSMTAKIGRGLQW